MQDIINSKNIRYLNYTYLFRLDDGWMLTHACALCILYNIKFQELFLRIKVSESRHFKYWVDNKYIVTGESQLKTNRRLINSRIEILFIAKLYYLFRLKNAKNSIQSRLMCDIWLTTDIHQSKDCKNFSIWIELLAKRCKCGLHFP